MAGNSEVAAVVSSISQNKIPKDFWNLSAFKDQPHIADLHVAVIDRLQMESPEADTLELMMMERVCFLYIFMRAYESAGDEVKFDRTYKEMMSLWVGMAADLRKTRLRAEELNSVRMAIVSEVSRALKEALKDVDPSVAAGVRTKMLSLVSA